MKTRLLKRLRRRATRQVRADWNGYEFTITWQLPILNRLLDEEERHAGLLRYWDEPKQEGFYVGRYKVYNTVEELETAIPEARRVAVLEMLKDYIDDKIKNRIKNI